MKAATVDGVYNLRKGGEIGVIEDETSEYGENGDGKNMFDENTDSNRSCSLSKLEQHERLKFTLPDVK